MSKAKMGRPTKEEALVKAIEAFGGLGIDFQLVDPRNILAAIAANPAASESALIRASIVLLGGSIVDYQRRKQRQESEEAEERRREESRREYEEADDAGRARMSAEAEADYHALAASLGIGRPQ